MLPVAYRIKSRPTGKEFKVFYHLVSTDVLLLMLASACISTYRWILGHTFSMLFSIPETLLWFSCLRSFLLLFPELEPIKKKNEIICSFQDSGQIPSSSWTSFLISPLSWKYISHSSGPRNTYWFYLMISELSISDFFIAVWIYIFTPPWNEDLWIGIRIFMNPLTNPPPAPGIVSSQGKHSKYACWIKNSDHQGGSFLKRISVTKDGSLYLTRISPKRSIGINFIFSTTTSSCL